MKSIDDYVAQIDSADFKNQVRNILMHFQAECFDHAAGLILDQEPTAVDPVGYRNLAAYFIGHALAVCPGHVTDPHLLKVTVSIPAPSPEVEKSDTPCAGSPALTGQDFGGTMPQPEPPADYVPESPESST